MPRLEEQEAAIATLSEHRRDRALQVHFVSSAAAGPRWHPRAWQVSPPPEKNRSGVTYLSRSPLVGPGWALRFFCHG
eukprot:7535873-Pyramimonas_sp.AAC.1